METDSVEAIKSFVAVGLGASFLPITAVEHELARGVLMQVHARGLGALRRRTALVRRVDHRPTFAMSRFLEIVGNGPAGIKKKPRRA
jgi:DNA-binding transcriptional LysR family regulator